jgi:hypothetical protein
MLTWKQRLELHPEYTEFRNWPIIDKSIILDSAAQKYDRNKRIVKAVLKGEKITHIAKTYMISRTTINKLLNRALGGDENSEPALSIALVPFKRINKNKRKSTESDVVYGYGYACLFTNLLLKNPLLVSNLDKMLLVRIQDKKYAQVDSVHAFFGEFKRTIAELSLPKDEYPYTTNSMGYEAVRKYFHRRKTELKDLNTLKKNKDRLVSISNVAYQNRHAMREIQIDEQLVDTPTEITIPFGDTELTLRLARFTLIIALDADTDCVLGCKFVFSRAANQQDMLSLLKKVVLPQLTPDLGVFASELIPGASYPSSLGKEFEYLAISNVKLDNAMIHLAYSVKSLICDEFGSTLSFGPPGKPNDRNWVEFAFKRCNQFSHRPASTTGSHIMDKKRESKSLLKKPPLINFKEFQQAIELLLVNHNITQQARLAGQSPLDAFSQDVQQLLLPIMPYAFTEGWNPLQESKKVKLHRNKDTGERFITFYYLKYRGSLTLELEENCDSVVIKYDRSDIRNLSVYSLTGNYFGQVRAPKSWLIYRHSCALRTNIMREVRRNRFHSSDPFANYFNELLQNKSKPSIALKLLNFLDETESLALSSGKQSKETNIDSLDEKSTIQEPVIVKKPLPSLPDWNELIEQTKNE